MSELLYARPIKITAARPGINLGSAWLVPLLLLPIAIAGPNTGLAIYACSVLGIGMSLLLRPGEPPILFLIFIYQWIQASVGLFYANLFGLPITSISEHDGQHELAIFLLLTGLLVLVLTIRLTTGPVIRGLFPRVQVFVAARPLRFWLWLFLGAWIFSEICAYAAGASGGLQQVFLSLANVKWVAFILLTLATFAVPNRPKLPWILVFGFQFVFSIGGYFSSFKDVFYFAVIGIIASNVRIKARVLISVSVLACILVFLGLVWTAIKKDYRSFVNGGSGQQVVLVSYSERVSEIGYLVSKLDEKDLPGAADQLMNRLMYFEFFGVVLDRVPNVLPYADGQIWLDAVRRPFMPRILFPNKSAVNDSDLTNRYTGLRVATASQGTSISMGYMAEAYIDFGPVLMFLPIAGLGLFLGAFYRRLLSQPGLGAALGVALAPFALMPALSTETSSLKLVPALGLSIISCWIIMRILAPRLFGLSRKARRRRSVWAIQRQRA
jgi:hypothetical protein